MSWPAAAALAFALGAPTLAHAQQSGLFPLAPIRRERVPCQLEDPVYRLYRQEYFGYHPTCWRRFPAGWGCPSPEAPNAKEAFKLLPRDEPPDLGPDNGDNNAPDGGRMAPGNPPGGEAPANPPPIPGGRSPFEVEKPDAAPRTNPPAGTTPNVPPRGERSPFEIDPQPGDPAKPAAQPTTTGSGPGASAATVELPVATATDNAPAPTPAPRDNAPAAAPTQPDGNDQPLLALPDPTVGPTSVVSSGVPPIPDPAVGALPNRGETGTPASRTPVQAPRRTSLLGNLFGGRGLLRR